MPYNAGVVPSPVSLRIRFSPKRFCQSSLPSMSYAYSPRDSKNAITCSPSVTAELDAHVPLMGCVLSWGRSSVATRSHTIVPSRRSIASTTKR